MKPKPSWKLAKEYEDEKKRLGDKDAVSDDLLFCHAVAGRYPEDSEDWHGLMLLAHRRLLMYAWLRREKGRPLERDLDDFAICYMDTIEQTTCETSARKLARMAIDAGTVQHKPSREAQVERLARKYKAFKREPRPLNLITSTFVWNPISIIREAEVMGIVDTDLIRRLVAAWPIPLEDLELFATALTGIPPWAQEQVAPAVFSRIATPIDYIAKVLASLRRPGQTLILGTSMQVPVPPPVEK
jgi:hypothetical protein